MKDIEPLVSICCITYNHENYIRDAIEGFLMQKTSFPIEIIIHDDASTDNTAQIIKEYEDKYPDLFCNIFQNENQWSKGGGSIFARFVYPQARGKYIALCEGDDYWTDPLKLQKQVDFLEENSEYSLVWSDVDKLIQDSAVTYNRVLSNLPIKNTLDDFLVRAWYIATCTWVYRTDIFDVNSNKYPFRETYSVGDFRLLLIALDQGKVCKYPNPESTAMYRVLKNSASHFKSFNQILKYQKGILQIQLDFAKYFKVANSVKFRIISQYLRVLIKRLLAEILYRLNILARE